MYLILIVLLIVFALGGLPSWPHNGFGYGYYPSGGIGLVVLILIVLLVAGRL